MKKRLYKSRENRVVQGVCGGIGDYLGIDPVIVRLIWVFVSLTALVGLGGLVAYLLACIIIPENNGYDDNNSRNDNDNYYY